MAAFQRAIKKSDRSEIEKISFKDLKEAKHILIKDKDTPWYSLLLERIGELDKGHDEISTASCGPLAKSSCDQKSEINKNYSQNNVFLDIPYSNYEDCEELLRNLLKDLGLNAVVAKDRLTSNAVLCKVCKLIKSCKYGISDISSISNSVAYEYGLMHGFGMKVCLTLREDSEKFTDIHGLEHLPYQGLRSLKIIVAKWILHNVDGVDKSKVEQIVNNEEKLLKEKGELPLITITPKIFEQGQIKLLEDNAYKEVKKRSDQSKNQAKGKPSRLLYATPVHASAELIKPKQLFQIKDACIIFPNRDYRYPCGSHELKTAHRSLIYHFENPHSNWFRYFEVNSGGIVFIEDSIYEAFKESGKIDFKIGLLVTLDYMYKFMVMIKQFYKHIGYSGEINLYLLMQNVKNSKLMSMNNFGDKQVGIIEYEDEVSIKKTINTRDLDANLDDIILDIYEELRSAGNVENAYARNITSSQLDWVKKRLP